MKSSNACREISRSKFAHGLIFLQDFIKPQYQTTSRSHLGNFKESLWELQGVTLGSALYIVMGAEDGGGCLKGTFQFNVPI